MLPSPRQIRYAVANGLTPLDLERHASASEGPPSAAMFTRVTPTDYPVRLGRSFVTAGEPGWPTRLHRFASKGGPLWLWADGRREVLDAPVVVAVTGGARPTHSEKRMAYTLGARLARSNVTVVTTMADGTDRAVMQGCLDRGGTVIVVLNVGLDVDYPEGTDMLKCRVREQGCLVSEFPPTMPVCKFNQYHLHNRVIAGLADAVVAVDVHTGASGLDLANRAVRVDQPVWLVATNPNRSLTDTEAILVGQGARIARSVEHVLDSLSV